MIDRHELVFAVDENNQPITPQLRSNAHKNGLWHRTTGIWVMNQKGQLLCQKRSLQKDIKPGFWEAFFGGHLAPGEDYLENAAKEASEELGILIDKRDLIPYKILKSDKPTHKEFQYICAFIVRDNIEFRVETDEVDELAWKSIDEVKDILIVKKESNWVRKPWDEDVLNWLLTIDKAK